MEGGCLAKTFFELASLGAIRPVAFKIYASLRAAQAQPFAADDVQSERRKCFGLHTLAQRDNAVVMVAESSTASRAHALRVFSRVHAALFLAFSAAVVIPRAGRLTSAPTQCARAEPPTDLNCSRRFIPRSLLSPYSPFHFAVLVIRSDPAVRCDLCAAGCIFRIRECLMIVLFNRSTNDDGLLDPSYTMANRACDDQSPRGHRASPSGVLMDMGQGDWLRSTIRIHRPPGARA
eukprot:2154635-Pleurochrysis_carterae.AAC.1